MYQVNTRLKPIRLLKASLLLLAMIAPVPSALAQEQDESRALEEVIVTAQKRAADVQSVPLAITAFSQDALDEQGITEIANLWQSVPSLQFTTTGNFTSGVVVTLRGIGTDVTTSGADQGVALHMDGVYLGKSSAALLSFFDLERLEVLRGPQGTLYGRNATGGSINVISQRPHEEFEAFGDVLFGNYDHLRLRAVINGPMGDRVAARLTATWEERNGYVENLWPGGGDDSHDADDWGIRGQLRIDASDTVEILASLYAAETGGVGPTINPLNQHPAATLVGLIQPPPLAGTPFGVPSFRPAYAGALPPSSDLHAIRTNANEGTDQQVSGAVVTVTWDLESVAFKSITGWFNNETDIFRDGDRTELDLYTKRRVEDASQFSQEFNLTSNSSGKWEWILGAFYYSDDVSDKDTEILFEPNASIPGATGTLFSFDSNIESTSWALFGQASYSISDKLRGTFGLRYSVDEKQGQTNFRNIEDLTNGLILVGFPQSGAYKETWEEPTGKIGLDYFVNDDSMLYLTFSTGYKSGGLNINSPDQATFDPELINAWEIGSKNRLADNRVELNVSAFYYDYDDLQLFSVTESAPFIQNAASSKIRGLEVESKILATDSLSLDMFVAYLDAEIKSFVTKDPADPPPLQVLEDLSGNRLPRAPEWEINVGAAYDWDLNNGRLTLSGRYHWQDDIFFRAQNDADKMQEGYGTYDARLTYVSSDDRWRVSAFGKNLGDEQAFSHLLVEAGLLGSPVNVVPIAPRTYGVEVGYRY